MADVEVALMELFDDLGYTVTSTPADLESRVQSGGRVLRVRRIGGGGDTYNDFPRVSVQCYAQATHTAPRAHFDLAELVELKLREIATYGPTKVGGVCVEEPVKDSGPVELLYPNTAVRVVETIFRLTVRY